ncbi:MAG TPA: hypothetical protein EYH06_06835 [Chromatiales bacterium]|nr:hypothetical protein [Thiotrichales bacterium]HIP68296.1 hypothetical protein [Chromatiales bacterium]
MLILLLQILFTGLAQGARQLIEVRVADPYLELHTGPGEGYPVFYVVERDDTITILKRKTNWYKVRTNRDKEGWVPREQLERTLLTTSDTPVEFRDTSGEDYPGRRWEVGILNGDFGGADMLTIYGAYNFTENFSTELALSQATGRFSDSYLADINLTYMFVPEWRITPFFKLGTGVILTEPKSTLIATEDRTDQTAHVGGGISAYITRRFVFRAEYNNYVVFTSRDDNEEVDEWKLGFAFFF